MSEEQTPYPKKECSHGVDLPHQIKGLPRFNDKVRNAVDHDTQKRLYAALEATGAEDQDTAYNLLLADAENGRKLRKVIEHYKGTAPIIEELRTLEMNKRKVRRAQQFFTEPR